MNGSPRSCCDPGELIDLSQLDFDAFFGVFSFCSDFVSRFAAASASAAAKAFRPGACSRDDDYDEDDAAPSTGQKNLDLAEFPIDAMDGYVDHLRLPASPTVGLDVVDPHFWWATFFIVFNPLFWNVVARLEHKNKILTRLCFGQAKVACALLGVVIILLGLWRDHLFNLTCHSQPSWIILRQNRILIIGYLCCVVGSIFVFTSFYQLGFYATFLGDYFGIFPHTAPVTSFPFSVAEDPMYLGSFFNFLGLALVKSSPAGVLLSLLVGVVYKAALFFETPFMKSIYEGMVKKSERREEEEESVPEMEG